MRARLGIATFSWIPTGTTSRPAWTRIQAYAETVIRSAAGIFYGRDENVL